MKNILGTLFLVVCVTFIIFSVITLTGCAKVTNTNTEVVEALIAEVDHDPMWFQPIRSGKITTIITHPADYDILLRYEDIETWVDVSSNEYQEYEDLVGTNIKVNLITEYYDDNTIKRYLELIGE